MRGASFPLPCARYLHASQFFPKRRSEERYLVALTRIGMELLADLDRET